MNSDHFDQTLKSEAERPELQVDWDRQRNTAREFRRRFEAGSDTQLLGDEVGMGKTYVALAVIADAVLRRGAVSTRALLVTPPSAVLRAKWEQEVRSFSSSYLVHRAGHTLRPLIVNGFWDLVANLHDHQNVEVPKITDRMMQSILFSLWQWALKKEWLTNKHRWWPDLEGFDPASADAMAFASNFSIAALEAFLENSNASGNNFLKAILKPGGALHGDETRQKDARSTIKKLFKEFAGKQDHYEPNVFILGMNSLRTPRSNKWENRRFATFVLSVILKGRWEATCKSILKTLKKTSLIEDGVKLKDLGELSQVDLYRTRDAVVETMRSEPDLKQRWDQILADPAAAGEKQIAPFFKDLVNAVVSRKLRDSGIRLAVIDEVHNWKSGANGAADFRRNFADVIRNKLLMSATPFQMADGELRTIFGYAQTTGGQTGEIVSRIFNGEDLIGRCLQANSAFHAAWRELSADEAGRLQDIAGPLVELDKMPQQLARTAEDRMAGGSLAEFARAAITYRDAVTALWTEQRHIMIRHVKPRGRRRFHAGEDFMKGSAHHTTLYAVDGLSEPRDAFINYLAMRLDQRIRADSPPGGAVHAVTAHLARGISSSAAAFKESRENKNVDDAGLSEETCRYMALFDKALAQTRHPKVAATVALTLRNYQLGRKTLIFCERVKTVDEIMIAVREGIEASMGQEPVGVAATRLRLLRDHMFIDMQWYRSWRRIVAKRHVDPADRSIKDKAMAFVQDRMQSVAVTKRRVLRLLDLWFLREEASSDQDVSPAHRLLADLASAVEESPDALGQVLNADTPSTIEQDELALSIEAVYNEGFLAGDNLWVDERSDAFERSLWLLADDEARRIAGEGVVLQAENLLAFYGILTDLQTGLRKVALRQDQLRRCLPPAAETTDKQAVFDGLRAMRDGGESTWSKLLRFVDSLTQANGTINAIDKTNTRRRNLWRGVELKEDALVSVLTGGTDPQARVLRCAAFNSPLAPDVLICTAIGSEGIDLHKECAEVIHHDLPWNPARLEQRTGRVDRVGCLAEMEGPGSPIRIGVPFLASSYDQFQYDKLLSRAQLFEVLMGKPAFDVNVDEEDFAIRSEGDQSDVAEAVPEDGVTTEAALVLLPDNLIEWLRVDLSLQAVTATATDQSHEAVPA